MKKFVRFKLEYGLLVAVILIHVTDGFSAARKNDEPNHGSVSDMWNFVCRGKGWFRDPRDCSRFFMCYNKQGSNADLQHMLVSCPLGFYFNPDKHTCDKSGRKYCDVDFECNEEGWFPDPDECATFFACSRGDDGDFIFEIIPCHPGLYFNSETLTCEESKKMCWGRSNLLESGSPYGHRTTAPQGKQQQMMTKPEVLNKPLAPKQPKLNIQPQSLKNYLAKPDTDEADIDYSKKPTKSNLKHVDVILDEHHQNEDKNNEEKRNTLTNYIIQPAAMDQYQAELYKQYGSRQRRDLDQAVVDVDLLNSLSDEELEHYLNLLTDVKNNENPRALRSSDNEV